MNDKRVTLKKIAQHRLCCDRPHSRESSGYKKTLCSSFNAKLRYLKNKHLCDNILN